jgi:hypothetical protein
MEKLNVGDLIKVLHRSEDFVVTYVSKKPYNGTHIVKAKPIHKGGNQYFGTVEAYDISPYNYEGKVGHADLKFLTGLEVGDIIKPRYHMQSNKHRILSSEVLRITKYLGIHKGRVMIRALRENGKEITIYTDSFIKITDPKYKKLFPEPNIDEFSIF